MFFLSVWKWHFNLAKLSKNKDEVDCKQKKEKYKGNIFNSPQIFFCYQKYEKVCFVLNILFFIFYFLRILATKLEHWPISLYDGRLLAALLRCGDQNCREAEGKELRVSVSEAGTLYTALFFMDALDTDLMP